MADLADLIQKLSFYQAGGKDPGTSTLDKINTSSDIVSKAISDVLAIKKAKYDQQKAKEETTKLNLANQQTVADERPLGEDYGVPTTAQDNQARIANDMSNASKTPIPAEPAEPAITTKPAFQGNEAPPSPPPAPYVSHRDARIAELQKQGINIPPAFYDIPKKDLKENSMAQAQLAAGGLKQNQLAEAKDKVYYDPKTGVQSDTPVEGYLYGKRTDANALAGKYGLQGIKNQQSTLSPVALENYAKLTWQSGMKLPPNLGMMGGGMKTQIMNRAAEIAAANGDTAQAAIGRQMAIIAGQQELNTVQKNRGVIGSLGKKLDGVATLVEEASKKVGADPLNTGIPILQRWINAGKTNINGDVDVNNLNTLVVDLIAEHARFMNTVTGGGAVADAASQRIQKNLDGANSPEMIQGWIDTIRKEKEVNDEAQATQVAQTKAAVFDAEHALKDMTPATPTPTKPAGPILRKPAGLNSQSTGKTKSGNSFTVIP